MLQAGSVSTQFLLLQHELNNLKDDYVNTHGFTSQLGTPYTQIPQTQ